MERNAILAALRTHEPELRAAGVARLWLFGSAARGTAVWESDVDLLATFDDTQRLSLLDVIGIENRLTDLLGWPVDLVEEGTLQSGIRPDVEREAVRAF